MVLPRGIVGSAATLAVAGCISLPDYNGPEGIPGVMVNEDGGAVLIQAHDYTLKFGIDESHMPESLTYVGEEGDGEMLGIAPDDESRIGIALFDRYDVHFEDAPGLSDSHRVVLARGPVKAAVEVTWSRDHFCGRGDTTSAESNGNTSRFTFFPDGRVVRHDLVQGRPCAGLTPMATYFTTFVTFDGSKFNQPPVVSDGFPNIMPGDSHPFLNDVNGAWTCLVGPQRMAGVTWAVGDASQFAGTRFRYRIVGDNAVTVYDWMGGSGGMPPLTDDIYNAHTGWLIRKSDCSGMHEFAQAFWAPPVVDGPDYDYDNGVWQLTTATMHAQEPVPRGFVVETHQHAGSVDRHSDDAVRERNLVERVDYLVQDNADSTQDFYFPDELKSNEALEFFP